MKNPRRYQPAFDSNIHRGLKELKFIEPTTAGRMDKYAGIAVFGRTIYFFPILRVRLTSLIPKRKALAINTSS